MNFLLSSISDLRKLRLLELLNLIDDPRKGALLRIYADHRERMHSVPATEANHQVWEGGYADHIAECLRLNILFYSAASSFAPLPSFTLDSAAIALFLHDVAKLARYADKDDPWRQRWVVGESAFTEWDFVKWRMLDVFRVDYDFLLSEEELNAIRYAHGIGNDYSPHKRGMCELAAHVHVCDIYSARVYHQEGRGLA